MLSTAGGAKTFAK